METKKYQFTALSDVYNAECIHSLPFLQVNTIYQTLRVKDQFNNQYVLVIQAEMVDKQMLNILVIKAAPQLNTFLRLISPSPRILET